jgi:hypothetical protein
MRAGYVMLCRHLLFCPACVLPWEGTRLATDGSFVRGFLQKVDKWIYRPRNCQTFFRSLMHLQLNKNKNKNKRLYGEM